MLLPRQKGCSCFGAGLFTLAALHFLFACLVNPARAQQPHYSPYVSPYSIAYSCPESSLTFDFNTSPRNDYTKASNTPFADWYDQSKYPVHNPNNGEGTSASWGPWAANYPFVTVPASLPSGCDALTWKRERVLRVAQEYIGYNYQHHHIPDFDPYATQPTWPASDPAVLVNYPTPGIDCSDFSSWNYNFGLGIVLNTAVATQALSSTPVYLGGGGTGTITPQVIGQPGIAFDTLVNTLQTGDLLYIRNAESTSAPVSHVIMWVGSIGVGGPDNLVLDSHDNAPPVVDANGITVPPGVHLRPFRQGEYYFNCFDHALRIIPVNTVIPTLYLILNNAP